MTDLIARFLIRGQHHTMTERGSPFVCISAEGTMQLDGIGHGKIVIPSYVDLHRPADERVTMGDICVVYSLAPNGQPQYIATFIVETKQYRDGNYEISGPDFIGELEEYVAIAPIGEEATVESTAQSMGAYLQSEDPNIWVEFAAAYPPRGYTTAAATTPGPNKVNIVFSVPMEVQVTDMFRYTFADGQIFETRVVGVSDGHTRVEIEEPIPQLLPAGAAVVFQSTRLRVADASIFVEASQVFYNASAYTGIDGPIPGGPGSFIIDRIERGDGDAPDYIYSADPFTDYILAGETISQKQYTQPTTNDVAQLLETNTFDEWSVIRRAGAVNGSAYAPNTETVWDVLLAICDITGYHTRRYFQGNGAISGFLPPQRTIEYFALGGGPTLYTLGTQNRVAADYGELFSLESDNANQLITHLFPYGGGAGSGRFDFRAANIATILADYDDLSWGVLGGQYFVYNATLVNSGQRRRWHVETFSHISPLNPSSFESRREAADMLLRAACDYLTSNQALDVTYSAEVFTLGEPLPGDKVSINWAGVDPDDIIVGSLIITEVNHRYEVDTGYRVTTLMMNKNAARRKDGPRAVASALLDMQRAMRHSNFGSRGDARITHDTIEFGGGGTVSSRTGDVAFRSATGNLEMTAAQGDVLIAGQDITLSGTVEVQGDIRMRSFILRDRTAAIEYEAEAFTLRGIPRVTLNRRAGASN